MCPVYQDIHLLDVHHAHGEFAAPRGVMHRVWPVLDLLDLFQCCSGGAQLARVQRRNRQCNHLLRRGKVAGATNDQHYRRDDGYEKRTGGDAYNDCLPAEGDTKAENEKDECGEWLKHALPGVGAKHQNA